MSRFALHTARAQLRALLVGLLMMAGLALAVTAEAARTRANGERTIGLASHLRQIARELHYLALIDTTTPAHTNLDQAFPAALALLRDGGELRGLAGLHGRLPPEGRHAIRADLDSIMGSWQGFLAAVAVLGALPANDPRRLDAIDDLAGSSLSVIAGLDQLQASYQLAMAEDTERATVAQLALQLGMIGLLVLGGLLIRRRIVRPAELLAAVGPASSPHALDRLATYDDEVRQLIRVFEVVRPELESSYAAAAPRAGSGLLLAAFEASRAIVELREAPQVLRAVMAHAEALIPACKAGVCLYPRESAAFSADLGLPIMVMSERAVPRGIGGCAECAFHGPVGQQRVSVPLQAGGVSLGAFCVTRKAGQLFGAFDLGAIEALAGAAGVAITNIRLTQAGQYHAQQRAIKAERERLAAELHDTLAQTLTYLSLGVERVRARVAPHGDDDALAEIAHVETTTRQAYSTVRTVLRGLRTPEAAPVAHIGEEIGAFIDEYRRVTGLVVELDLDPAGLAHLGPLAQTQALHIVREALSNVHRHAGAHRVVVRARPAAGTLSLLVEDDGRGFDPAVPRAGEQLGLSIMRMRATQVGGELRVSAAPGAGTVVAATFPLAELSVEHSM